MFPSLESINAKLARARDQIEALQQEVLRAQSGNAYSAVPEINPQSGDKVWRLKVHRAEVMRLAVLIGEPLYNLRSALDHLVYQLSLAQCDDPERTGFPIFSHKTGIRKPGKSGQSENCFERRGRNRIQYLSDEAKEIIEAVQPYNRCNPVGAYLWLTHELNNLDKHRLAIAPIVTLTQTLLNFSSTAGRAPLAVYGRIASHSPQRCDDGDILLGVAREDIYRLDEKEEPEFGFQIVFDVALPYEFRPLYVMSTLRNIHEAISDNLVPQFSGFF